MALPAAAQAYATYTAQEQEFLRLINDYRQANGLGTLLISDMVSDAAEKHNKDMGKYAFFDHYTQASDYFQVGASPWDRMALCGYGSSTSEGENIAAGSAYTTAAAVIAGWKASPGHDANMRQSDFKVIGISMDTVPGSLYGTYWTTDFGGFVDPSARELGGGTTTTNLPAGFIDVPADYRFYHEVMSLAGAEIIGGFSDGSFRPDDPVKRAQFAKIIMLAVGGHTDLVEAAGEATFPDVPWEGVCYPFDYIEETVDLGIIKGLNGGLFGPYDDITRAQLALMLVRAGGAALATPPQGYVHGFADVPAFADEAVAIARYNGLLSGKTEESFDPYGAATRGQVARMTSNLVERLNQ
jgi:Cysteine-rich secretory protein family/S-layer homology domain